VSAKTYPVKAEPAELGPRKLAVLRVIVQEYVRTGEPVGSETIAERAGLGVSPATIRNEMAALEELGYLTHPHTSAGRLPTDLAYRRYVDTLPPGARLRDSQRRAIAGFFAEAMIDLEEVLRGTTQLLGRLTQYAGLAVPPGASEEESVAHVEIVDLGPTVLALVVGRQGRVEKAILDRPAGLDGQAIESLERRLDDASRDRPLPEVQARILRMAGEAEAAEREILRVFGDLVGAAQRAERGVHVVVGGVANLADEAAHWRRETVHRLIEALERESELLRILRDASAAQDVSVTIGGEDPSTERWGASVVAAPFTAGEMQLGTVGVVGPTAMDYLTVVASVRAVARRLSELAAELEA
jgi:heat-inducible transcriptional repressor